MTQIQSHQAARLRRLRQRLKKLNAAAMLVTKPVNVNYLTGFTGHDSWLLVTPERQIVLSDFRYETQLSEECAGFDIEVRRQGVTLAESASKLAASCAIRELAIEAASLTVAEHQLLTDSMQRAALHPLVDIVEGLREIKDRGEIAQIRRSITYAQRAFSVIRAQLRGDQTERSVAAELEYQIRQFGGEGCSFDPIVAVGRRAALPHAVPTEGRIDGGDFVLIDWGATAGGYASDLTRVLVTAKISPKLARVYGVVLNAQLAAIAAIRPGALMSDVDAAARTVIAKAGFGSRFGHSLGHGIGLEIHEAPRLAAKQDRPLKAGMVVTVEPGVYLPKWGGVRIEDDVLVTRDGHEILSNVTKDLEQCQVP